MKQKIFLVLVMVMGYSGLFSQTNQEKAKTMFFEAQYMNTNGKYAESNQKLKEVQSLLGSNNLRIQLLVVKNTHGLKNDAQTKKEIDTYLSMNPENDEAFQEVMKIKSSLCEKTAQIGLFNQSLVAELIFKNDGLEKQASQKANELSGKIEELNSILEIKYNDRMNNNNLTAQQKEIIDKELNQLISDIKNIHTEFENYENSLRETAAKKAKNAAFVIQKQLLLDKTMNYDEINYSEMTGSSNYYDITSKVIAELGYSSAPNYNLNKSVDCSISIGILNLIYLVNVASNFEYQKLVDLFSAEYNDVYSKREKKRNDYNRSDITQDEKNKIEIELDSLSRKLDEIKTTGAEEIEKKEKEIINTNMPIIKNIINDYCINNNYKMIFDYSFMFDEVILVNNLDFNYSSGIVTDVTMELVAKIKEINQ